MVWSKASHLMSRKWAFCGMMCNLLCKSRKTIHEKSRFKALKTWIIYFFECDNLLRIQDGPFNPKYFHFDFWFDTPLEQCALGVNRRYVSHFKGLISSKVDLEAQGRDSTFTICHSLMKTAILHMKRDFFQTHLLTTICICLILKEWTS